MKIIRVITVFIFTFILLLPVVFFNFDEDAVSVIDNRMLAPNPFVESDESFQTRLSNYISDRNRLREIMIRTYNVWNDRLFNVMTQPGFVYGKDGQVFGHGLTTGNDYGRLQDAFAEMVVKINDYCDERDIPFLFVVEPAKPAVYTDELPDGINYDRQWVDMLMDNLRLNGVPVLDNAVTMRRLREEGIEPYNRMFDPNHWNAMGAFYGSAEILSCLFEQYPGIHINDLSEFTLSYRHMDTLTGSANFPIDEDVPVLTPVLRGVHTITDEYEGLQIDPHYNKFEYYINPTRLEEGGPRVMVFQGSYFNGVDDVYFQNAFCLITRLLGFYTEVERTISDGRIDMIAKTKDFIYIFEFKYDKSADAALQQIDDKGYAAPFATDPRKLYKVGVNFNRQKRCIDEWKIE